MHITGLKVNLFPKIKLAEVASTVLLSFLGGLALSLTQKSLETGELPLPRKSTRQYVPRKTKRRKEHVR